MPAFVHRTAGKWPCLALVLHAVLGASACGSDRPVPAPLDAFNDPAASQVDAGMPTSDPDDLPGQTSVADGGTTPLVHDVHDGGAIAESDAAIADAGTDALAQSFAVDPSKVYLLGTLAEGAASRVVLCDPTMPDVVMGFPVYDKKRPPVISPSTHDVYYADSMHALHRVHPTRTSVSDDSLVSTAACADESGPLKLDYIAFDPTGLLYFACRNSVYDENGNAFPRCTDGDDNTPLAMAANGTMLCSRHILIDGVAFALQGPDGERINLHDGVARARDDGGFWFVRADKARYQRWSVSEHGSATLDGTYADAPGQWKPQNTDEKGILEIDGDGALYRWGHSLDLQDQIAFFSADFSSSEVIYDEADAPRCKFDASTLITGP
jgi:hypothetical protein